VARAAFRAYAAVRNPEIKPDKLIHFALGMFWKASVHSWKGGVREPLIDVGPYRETVRKFVRGEIPFPERMALTIGAVTARKRDRLPRSLSRERNCLSSVLFLHVGDVLVVQRGESGRCRIAENVLRLQSRAPGHRRRFRPGRKTRFQRGPENGAKNGERREISQAETIKKPLSW